jgi:hypothetical protein
VETIDYFLRHHREQLQRRRHKRERVAKELEALEQRLRGEADGEAPASADSDEVGQADAASARQAS